MDDSATCNVSGSLATLLRISSTFGLAPLHFSPIRRVTQQSQHEDISTLRPPKHKSHCNAFIASVSRRLAYFGRGLIILLLIFQAVVLSIIIEFAFQNTKHSNVLFSISLALSWISLIVATFDCVNRIKRYMIHLNKIEKIHNMLNSSYIHQNIMKTSKFLWMLPLALILRFILTTLFRVKVVLATNNTTTYINGYSIKTKSTKNEHKALHHMRLVYLSICELIRNIDEGEGVLLFILLLYKIVDIMSTLYVTLAFFKLGGEFFYGEIAEYGFIVTWIFYDGALISLLVEPCHQTHAELQKVKVFISHLLCFWPERNFRSELSHFYNECVNNVIVFSPLGVFTLTRKFIVTVIGAIITFITIIRQFHLKDTLPVQIY